MPSYRSKDEVDLAWNEWKRRITAEIDLELRRERERLLNERLTAAFTKFNAALARGVILEIES